MSTKTVAIISVIMNNKKANYVNTMNFNEYNSISIK
jgi:hypothetical protein